MYSGEQILNGKQQDVISIPRPRICWDSRVYLTNNVKLKAGSISGGKFRYNNVSYIFDDFDECYLPTRSALITFSIASDRFDLSLKFHRLRFAEWS